MKNDLRPQSSTSVTARNLLLSCFLIVFGAAAPTAVFAYHEEM